MKVGTDAMLLGAGVEVVDAENALDIGAGTGVISLMIAQRFPGVNLVAVEIDEASAKECAVNFQNSRWSERLKIYQGDFLDYDFNQSFDLIVSNPPYYQTRLENEDTRKSQARHESALPMADMLAKVSEIMSQNGAFWLIVPVEVSQLWIDTAEENELFLTRRIDVTGKVGAEVKRTILAFSRTKEEVTKSELVVRNADGSYTDEYINLTCSYHYNDLRSSGK